jgi:hypothetical protein
MISDGRIEGHFLQTPIGNQKSNVLVDGCPTPAHKTRCQMGRSEETAGRRRLSGMMRAYLKTWPATPVGASLAQAYKVRPKLVEVASINKKEQPGSASHPRS